MGEGILGVDRLQGAPEGALLPEMDLPMPDHRGIGRKAILERLPQPARTDLATVGA
ncbi:hypothetical protein WJ438_28635 [Streptomyces sp. GD-15H]|uniref:hypothetical protein n=1 Tax=Streptomyces sp. GD-15H TaxID=3129112 RepID=UPI00324341A1